MIMRLGRILGPVTTPTPTPTPHHTTHTYPTGYRKNLTFQLFPRAMDSLRFLKPGKVPQVTGN